MAKGKKKWLYLPGLLLFFIYFFIFPRSIPVETILKPRWIASLESNYLHSFDANTKQRDESYIPFTLGDHFGYLMDNGQFAISKKKNAHISLSKSIWTEYDSTPIASNIMDPLDRVVNTIENPKGYPMLLDDRVFIVGIEQNNITAIDGDGKELWIHDFPAHITCVDSAGGYLLAGTLNGAVVLLNPEGDPVFTPFEPGGSRLSVILGCAISSDASRIALISGIADQRFLLLEQSADTYRVVYHEFISEGFRRPVHIGFTDNDTKIIFEREGGIGIYNIGSRSSVKVNLDGNIEVLDSSGENGFLFALISRGVMDKSLITIKYPGLIVNETPFKSENSFFARQGNQLYLGGDLLIASFDMEKR